MDKREVQMAMRGVISELEYISKELFRLKDTHRLPYWDQETSVAKIIREAENALAKYRGEK
jgi:hypothetical protein